MDIKKPQSARTCNYDYEYEYEYINTKLENDKLYGENDALQKLRKGLEECKKENVACEKELSAFYRLQIEPQTVDKSKNEELSKSLMIMRSEEMSSLSKTSLDIIKRRKNIADMEYNISLKEINMELNFLNGRIGSLQNEINSIQKAVQSTVGFVSNAEKDLEDFSSQDVIMKMKLKEYNQTLEKLTATLDNLKIHDLQVHLITEKYKQYLAMIEENIKLDNILSEYHDLPPNLLEAKVILEKKQKDYDNLENKFVLYKYKNKVSVPPKFELLKLTIRWRFDCLFGITIEIDYQMAFRS
ncbi:PREDICTED: uncharacterized protein LOC107069180 [Polistes dominula]|uniref:Uncharacterized protein LOC107069180 n=1 Tax=Polistes dominula TaxID=743375 RepID=A0ABM1INF9_POLDO|nr:PREDICTED: uncharacterized protein LOC107069180 [Polistes dominula]